MNEQTFEHILHSGRTVHLVGIGGVSMRALARMLRDMGVSVRGSDRDESAHTQALRESGIPVTIGHRAENVLGPPWSSAPPPSGMTIPRSPLPGRKRSPWSPGPRPGG